MTGRFHFEGFLLDTGERQLRLDDEPVELNGRYLDALALLVREQGRLVPKDRFMDEVWRGVPVTDEALTQCIRNLRRQLGDDAANPRFIETVPKHGYRFIAPVRPAGGAAAPMSDGWRRFLVLGVAGTLGGALAGFIGGLIYGFAAGSHPDVAAASALLVVLCITMAVAWIGGAGVGFGMAAASLAAGRPWRWSIVGGAAGGLVVGAAVKLLGVDAFNLVFGRSPGDITGAPEGLVLGGAVGLGALLASRLPSLRLGALAAGLVGGAAGVLIVLLGGRLMGGSLDLLASRFPSRLRLDQMGALFGEDGYGPLSQAVTGGLEGFLFAACVVGAMLLAQRRLDG